MVWVHVLPFPQQKYVSLIIHLKAVGIYDPPQGSRCVLRYAYVNINRWRCVARTEWGVGRCPARGQRSSPAEDDCTETQWGEDCFGERWWTSSGELWDEHVHSHKHQAHCLISLMYLVCFRLKIVDWEKMSRKKMWKHRQKTTSLVKDLFIYDLSALLITAQGDTTPNPTYHPASNPPLI